MGRERVIGQTLICVCLPLPTPEQTSKRADNSGRAQQALHLLRTLRTVNIIVKVTNLATNGKIELSVLPS